MEKRSLGILHRAVIMFAYCSKTQAYVMESRQRCRYCCMAACLDAHLTYLGHRFPALAKKDTKSTKPGSADIRRCKAFVQRGRQMPSSGDWAAEDYEPTPVLHTNGNAKEALKASQPFCRPSPCSKRTLSVYTHTYTHLYIYTYICIYMCLLAHIDR